MIVSVPISPSASLPLEQSLLPETAEVAPSGHLIIGGCDVVDLAEEFGTPLFIYDEEHLRARCREAVAAFGEGVAYATKAFLCKAMAQLVHEEGMHLDVASEGELHAALDAGVPASSLKLHGNNKSEGELRYALDIGINQIVIDSHDEIDRLAKLVGPGRRAHVLLRVTPGVSAHTHEYIQTGQEDSKFGLSIASGEAANALGRLSGTEHIEIDGIHAHIGSQVFDVSSLAKAAEVLAKFFVPLGLRELCVGGGLGIAYLNGEVAPSITQWADAVHEALA